MRLILIILALLAAGTVAALGVRGQRSENRPIEVWGDMADQPRYRTQGQSAFFADGRSMRPPPAGAVPWGRQTGKNDPQYVVADKDLYDLWDFPAGIKVDEPFVRQGKVLFERFCMVCHGSAGSGNGPNTVFGMNAPPSYHTPRLREVGNGYLFKTITEGKNTMGAYGDRIQPADRWKIIAYVRALQRWQEAGTAPTNEPRASASGGDTAPSRSRLVEGDAR